MPLLFPWMEIVVTGKPISPRRDETKRAIRVMTPRDPRQDF
jgi:hypothetical protein